MNLSKFLKGTTTIRELEQLPNRYVQVIYKEYLKSMDSPEAANEAIGEEIVEAMGG